MNKNDIDRSKVSEEIVRTGLEKITHWARHHRQIPFGNIAESHPGRQDELLRLVIEIEKGFDFIDEIIFGYEILVEERKLANLRKYRMDKVHNAGTSCYNELNRRLSRLDKIGRWLKKEPEDL